MKDIDGARGGGREGKVPCDLIVDKTGGAHFGASAKYSGLVFHSPH